MADGERLETVARLMSGISEIDDLNVMRDSSSKLLQQKILELAEEERHMVAYGVASSDPRKVRCFECKCACLRLVVRVYVRACERVLFMCACKCMRVSVFVFACVHATQGDSFSMASVCFCILMCVCKCVRVSQFVFVCMRATQGSFWIDSEYVCILMCVCTCVRVCL